MRVRIQSVPKFEFHRVVVRPLGECLVTTLWSESSVWAGRSAGWYDHPARVVGMGPALRGCGGGTALADLLPRVAAGEAAAVRECIDRYGGLVWSLARRMLYASGEVDDAVQEVFVEIWRNAGKFRAEIASETAFVGMIARRRLIDRRRRLDRRQDKSTLPEQAEAPAGVVGERAIVSEEARAAAGVFEQLAPEQQRCLRLAVYEGLSHEKIAAATGLPLGTVKTHVRRGLIRIREVLRERGLGVESGQTEGVNG